MLVVDHESHEIMHSHPREFKHQFTHKKHA